MQNEAFNEKLQMIAPRQTMENSASRPDERGLLRRI